MRQQQGEGNQSEGGGGGGEGGAVSQEFLMDVVAHRSRCGCVDCQTSPPPPNHHDDEVLKKDKEQALKTPDLARAVSQDFIMEIVAARSTSRTVSTVASEDAAMATTNPQVDLVTLEEGTVCPVQQAAKGPSNHGRRSTTSARSSTHSAATASLPGAFSVVPTTTTTATRTSDAQSFGAESSAEISEFSSGGGDDYQDELPTFPPPPPQQLERATGGRPTMPSRGLSVAQMVVSEELSYEIQDATPEPTETAETGGEGGRSAPKSHRQRKQSFTKPFTRKTIKPCLCFAGIILVIVVVVLLIILITRTASSNKQNSQHNSQQSTPSSSTSAPTSLEDRVLSLLPEETERQALFKTQSAQQRALEWLLQDDNLSSYSDDRIVQKFALGAFYYETNGQDWRRNDHWLNHSIHECDWFNNHEFALKEVVRARGYDGYLTEFDEPAPVRCNPEGLIQHLWLDANNLEGTLPEELYMMTSLVTISIGLNQLVGTLSSRIGDLRQLEAYSLWNQKSFGGTIPTEIGLCTNLRGFGLYDNSHHGTLPTEIWKLTKLSSFILYLMPNLHSSIPSQIGNLSELRWFTMSASDFRGPIPSEMGQLSLLEWLNLGWSKFTGTVPSQVGHLSSLGQMVVENNALEGTLPSELGLLTQATLLSFNDNQFRGSIPTHLGMLSNLSLGLSLQNNELSDTLPTELGLMRSLQTLAVQNNNLFGPIPSQLGQMSSAGSLNLENNAFSGSIPIELSAMETSLFAFHLGGNPDLEGILPESLCQLNSTCAESRLNPTLLPCSDEMDGLTFDCTEQLCGCDCECSD